jgi:hypothetical protein
LSRFDEPRNNLGMPYVVKMTGSAGHSVWLTGPHPLDGHQTLSSLGRAAIFASCQHAQDAIDAVEGDVNTSGAVFEIEAVD